MKYSRIIPALSLVLLHAGLFFHTQAQAASPSHTKITVTVDRVGDGKFAFEMKMPAFEYTNLKKNTTNMAVLMRRMDLPRLEWWEMKEFKGEFDDGSSTLKLNWTVRGLARTGRDNTWEIPLVGGELTPVTVQDHLAVFTTDRETWCVYAPEGSKNLKVHKTPQRLTYQPPAPAADGQKTAVDFTFQAQAQVLSSLAKTYAGGKFSKLWVARSVFKNTGDQTVKNYKIRFRLDDFAPWSEWQANDTILPGQTAVDAYFPVLDLDKVAKLNGSRPTTLEVEYEYQKSNGATVRESDSKRVQILSRNEAITTSMTDDDAIDWYDYSNILPLVLASFVTPEDPIMQQVAGWVNGQAGGVAASVDDKSALKFMDALYTFMSVNKIAYQSPPAGIIDGRLCQHIKYGRDVLRNRAGTCVDLAIFYASACQAAGLRPVLFSLRGHAFPAVRLPSGEYAAVEVTGIGKATFDQMLRRGKEEIDDLVKNGKQHRRYDIQALHDQGVRGLDLPALAPGALSDWGIKAVKAGTRAQVVPDHLVGTWTRSYKSGNQTITSYWRQDADGAWAIESFDPGGKRISQGVGMATFGDDYMVATWEGGWEVAAVTMLGGNKGFRYEVTKASSSSSIGNVFTYEKVREKEASSVAIPDGFVGKWRTDYKADGKKVTIYWTQDADGTFSYKAYRGKKLLDKFGGTCTLADGVLKSKWDGGYETAKITWINDNSFKYEVVKSSTDGFVGTVLTVTRQK